MASCILFNEALANKIHKANEMQLLYRKTAHGGESTIPFIPKIAAALQSERLAMQKLGSQEYYALVG